MKVIGFTGKMASGKTTCATHLVTKENYQITSFAKPLKDTMISLFELTEEQVYNLKIKNIVDSRYNKTPRELMQLFGTECIREIIHPDFWVMKMEWFLLKMKEKEELSGVCKKIVIDDVRFENEANLIRDKFDGTIIHLERKNNPFNSNHKSEQPISVRSNEEVISASSVSELLYKLNMYYYSKIDGDFI